MKSKTTKNPHSKMNVFLFIPLGFFFPYAMKHSIWETVLIGVIVSIAIEALQYIFCLGLCEFDDVFHNTLGTALGYCYYHGINSALIKNLSQN